MECTKPNYMILTGEKNGKPSFTFLPNVSYNRLISEFHPCQFVEVPCGHCLSCKIAYSRSWADRIALESKKYKDNYFVTLTFDDEHLPRPRTDLKWIKTVDDEGNKIAVIDKNMCKRRGVGSLHKRYMQLFIKRLRRCLERRGYTDKLVFFGCGEYGDESLRCHLHLILLNCPLNDLTLDFKQMVDGQETIFRRSGKDGLFFSQLIYDCWHRLGEISVAPFSYDTASYVAQYCQKKYDPVSTKVRDELDLAPEFVLMSKGIALDALKPSLYQTDNIIVDGHISAIPRYFDKKVREELDDYEWMDFVGFKRLKKKLIRVKDYVHTVQNKDRIREVQNLKLIAKNKLRNKI